MKKIIFGIIVFSTFLLGMIQRNVFAEDLNVQTDTVQEYSIQTAKDNWESYLNGLLIGTNKTLNDFYLGTGFNILTNNDAKISAFPIIEKKNKKIDYVLQVAGDSILLSQKLGEALNNVSENSVGPVTIAADDQNYFYKENGEFKQLTGADTCIKYVPKSTTNNKINIAEKLEESNLIQPRTAVDHVLLPWTVYELQTDMPWCEFYAINTIVNNLAGKEIMNTSDYIHEVYPNATEAELTDDDWITRHSIVDQHNYLKKHYNISVKYDMDMFKSFDKVKNELKVRKVPFVVDVSDQDKILADHALVQVGYTASSNASNKPYYYYWNPWWKDIFVVSSTAPYIQLGQTKFVPKRAQYNFSSLN
ncbi:hypothetical protein G8B50_08120 [Enterococcus durans]|uniref:C47 family peptidase n=1 Tax=Enterococcus durans TaxID=53345 RepID=UPI0018847828|nr:C47 family peptidase [Enterococcus durans]MBE9887636.1 hypothetical protein [Enterococcus durans]